MVRALDYIFFVQHTHIHTTNLLFWLFRECDLNGVQLGGMVPPHPPLAVNKPSQDQQGKQDRVHLPEDLEGGEVEEMGRGAKGEGRQWGEVGGMGRGREAERGEGGGEGEW